MARLREFVIFSQSSFRNPDTAAKQAGFLQGVQERVKATRADLITERVEGLAQFVAVYRSQAGLMKNEDPHHALEKIPVDAPSYYHSRYMTYVG
jgi:hypothetical protein